MTESVHQPHDKLVTRILSDPVEMEGFLKANLPTDSTNQTEEALTIAAELLTQLPQTGGTNYLRVFFVYILAAQDRVRPFR